jgi:hypothetical protein
MDANRANACEYDVRTRIRTEKQGFAQRREGEKERRREEEKQHDLWA